MQWNIAPEYVSLVFVSILLVYSHEYNLIPTFKNKLFRFFLYFVFFEILVSIASIHAIENYSVLPEIANQAVQMLYFLSPPLLSVFFMLFFIALIREDDSKIRLYFRIIFIPYAIYALLVLSNPMTGLLYDIRKTTGFTEGRLYFLVYVIPLLYNFVTYFIILMNRRMIERSLRLVLLFFLTISLSMVLLQWIFPMLILSGSAATTMLLVIYLYLQNKNIILDDLTGLQNRKAFSKILEYYVRQKAVMDIILISLDDFKAVNDRFGQWNGDIFLKTISQYLKDIIPIKFIYRFSGDEFIIILDESIPVNAADLVDTIRKRFDDTWECGTFRCMQKTSIAIVRVPFHADTVEKIITLLEYCIDLSKKNGKGKTIFSDKETIKKMTRKIKIIDLMKKGLTQDIFEVYYQPVYSVKKNRFTTAEALLRLSDSELGAVSPVEFIPIAEETGIIADIGLQVLDKVCHFVKELENREVAIDAISINLSTVQLNSEDFVSGFLGIIDRNMVSPGKLRMEITESVFNNKFECVVDIMKIFNDHGIRFYLDDFGAGYSNIANIVDLPFEFIKIDSSILHKSVGSKKCLDVLNGLSRTFSEAGIKVLVEGVETPEHDEIARQIHADYIQGFLYAYPMPADDFIQYMKKSNP